MKKHLLMALVFCLGITSITYGQESAINWARTYGATGPSAFRGILKTADGGYVTVGEIGANSNAFMVKYSSTGTEEWSKTYGGTKTESLQSVISTADGGYIAVGYTNSNNGDVSGNHSTKNDIWVVKTDSVGVLQWQKCYGNTGDDMGAGIVAAADGNYFIAGLAGYVDGSDQDGGYLMKINTTGVVLWQKAYSDIGVDEFFSIAATADGGCIAAGFTAVVKADTNGNLQWQKNYLVDDIKTIIQTPDGGYFIAGDLFSDGWAAKLTSTGALTWAKRYPNAATDEDIFEKALLTSDGGYVLVGTIDTYGGESHPTGEMRVLKLNATGDKVWEKIIGGSDADRGTIIEKISDTHYIIGGRTRSNDGHIGGGTKSTFRAWLANVTIGTGPIPALDLSLSALSTNIANDLYFEKTQLEYTLHVAYGVKTLKVTPTVSDLSATITVNGTTVASGTASGNITLAPGNNTIGIVVTSAGGTATKTYTITVIRPLTGSNNASLSSLQLYSVSPFRTISFINTPSLTTTMYVPADVASVNLTAGPPSDLPIEIDGVPRASGGVLKTIAMDTVLAPLVVNLKVTAEDEVTVKNYQVTIVRTGATALSGLTLSSGTLSPALTAGVFNYYVSVTAGTSTITLTPASADSTAVITVNGSVVASGQTSAPIALALAASTYVPVTVRSVDGYSTATYNITVFRPNYNTRLKSLALSNYAVVSPVSGSPNTFETSVPSTAGNVSLIATTDSPDSHTYLANGTLLPDSAASAPIAVPTNPTTINFVVKAPNGDSTVYHLIVKKNGLNNTFLVNRSIEPGAVLVKTNAYRKEYAGSVDAATTTIKMRLTARDPNATISINGTVVPSGELSGDIALTGSATVISVVVTAQDGVTTENYTFTITRNGSNSTYLTSLKLVSPNTDLIKTNSTTAERTYTALVAAATTSIKVKPTADYAGAVITVQGTPVSSGALSAAIPLSTGYNVITVHVTAEDGVTTRNYVITVHRPAPALLAAAKTGSNIPNLKVTDKPEIAQLVQVRRGLSPNGDGINDGLVIEGINAYPENKLTVFNKNGDVIFQSLNYDNHNKLFDGRSSKGILQPAGTYFYSLEFTKEKQVKRQTGYIVIKY